MEIISGTAKSIKLSVPKGLFVRPTGGRARKALFDSLAPFTGKKILDLFAGTGAMGLEAASRGATQVVFVEKNRLNSKSIEENIPKVEKAGVVFKHELICTDALNPFRYIRSMESPDFIFADPPYADSPELFTKLTQLDELAQWAKGAKLIWEVPDSKQLANSTAFMNPGLWKITSRRNFGGTDFIIAVVAE